jgi:hypothetical protein
MLAGKSGEAIGLGREALAMAEELGIDELRSHALNSIGIGRLRQGDRGGLEDLEQSVVLAVASNTPESVRAYGNLASTMMDLGDVERARAANAEGLALVERFGLWEPRRWLTAETAWFSYFGGDWDEAHGLLDELISIFVDDPFWMEGPCRWLRGRIRLARDDLQGAHEDATRGLELGRSIKDPQALFPALAFAARAFLGTDRNRVGSLVSELLEEWQSHDLEFSGSDSEWPIDLVVALHALGRGNEFVEPNARARVPTPWRRAAAFYASGEFREAADVYADIGARPEEAYARLRAAESLVSEGSRAEANAELQRSLAFWRSVGAAAYVREGEALLAEAG